jgi:DNA polymerase V
MKCHQLHPESNPNQFPMKGKAACGLFGITEDFEEAYLSLDELMVKNKEATFFFAASGNSMEPLICEGDVLVVDCSKKPQSGQIVVVEMQGERFCKRLVKRNGALFLISENKAYKPIRVTEEIEMRVFGRVTGIARVMK